MQTEALTMLKKITLIVLLAMFGHFSYCQCGAQWMQVKSAKSGLRIGDLDISGDQITVEALINLTATYSGLVYAGDIVSKHRDPDDVNYLLRPNDAEITTSNGFFRTPDICPIELNKTYHVAMVYDGKTLKFYRNGFLMSQVAATGNLFLNDWITTIGTTADLATIYPTDFIGFINEVRIWKIARTQEDIQSNMFKELPDPGSQTGLLAYYRLDNSKNKLNNGLWDGTILNDAELATENETCASFVADSCGIKITTPVIVTPSFTALDTVCVGTTVSIKNTSTGAGSYYWNFCVADINKSPTGTNLGNLGSALVSPVYSEIVSDNGNYYVFIVNNYPGNLVRLDFGNSLLNTPTAADLGNFSGEFPKNAEGIQVIKNNGRWYAIVVGGDISFGNPSKIVKIDFGSSLVNNNPDFTDWGNIGDLSYPHDLYLFNEENNWYGFTANSTNNTITRFSFGTNFLNPPSATNLGNIGDLSYPTGITSINSSGKWYAFITNGKSSTLTRLDFGTSLLNSPAAINLGNISNNLHACWDISIIKFCGETTGFVVNGDGNYNDIVKLSFGDDITNTPTAISLGNIGNLSFPHSLSKLFRIGADVYTFIPNALNNTLTRLKFEGCNNASIPNSTAQNPPDIKYNSPGIYNINLTVDEGLPTQSAYCKPVVVVAPLAKQPLQDTAACKGDSIVLKAPQSFPEFQWSTGSIDSSINVSAAGNYWVETKYYGCTTRDSFLVKQNTSPVVDVGNDTALCTNNYIVLNATNTGSTYLWSDGTTNQTDTIYSSGTYNVRVTNSNNCSAKDSIIISLSPSPVITGLSDTTICTGSSFKIQAASQGDNTYQWSPATNLSNTSIINPVATPASTTTYFLTVKNNSKCVSNDSITISVAAKPVIDAGNDTAACNNTSVQLKASVSNADQYYWSPSQGLTDTTSLNPAATISNNINYIFTAINNTCKVSDTVSISVLPSPNTIVTPANATICTNNSIQLTASGGEQYHWSPASGLTNTEIANPVANPISSTIYYVTVTGNNTCTKQDSAIINVKTLSPFTFNASASTVCSGDTVLLSANGGNQYNWSLNQNIYNPNAYSAVASPTAATTYYVVITDTFCKVTDTLSAAVNVTAALQLSVSKSNDVDCNNPQSQLTASGATTYTWQPAATISNAFIYNPVVTPSQTTTYYVTGSNNASCSGTDSITVKVSMFGDDNLSKQMANAFTPNNDGINDCFGFPKWGYVKNADFSIYNRWGQLLFRTNTNSQCWDGAYKGQPQPAGAYVYQIKATTLCGTVYRKGTVVLIR